MARRRAQRRRLERGDRILSCVARTTTTKLVPPVGTEPILDMCTGTGDLALAYDRAAQGRVPIIGADFCPEMLRLAKAKVSRITQPIRLLRV